MPLTEKHGFNGGMNADDNPRLIDPVSTLNVMNGRVSVSKQGRDLRFENIPGTTLVPNLIRPPYGQDQTIGTAQDVDNGRVIFFNYNTFGDHGIYCYDPSVNRIDAIIYDSQVIGGLGFSKNSLIHSAFVINGNVYWTDSTNNEPRRVNINAGIEMNRPGTYPVTPYKYSMNQSVLRWIRRQPGLVLTGTKNTDANFANNFIKNEGFQFAWRYTYRDYEISTLSGLSTLNNYNNSTDTFNYITVSAPLGEFIDQDVIQVDFIAKYMNSQAYFVFRSWNVSIAADFYDIYNHNYNSIPLTTNFYNDTLGTALDAAYSVKQYDNVPIYAQTCETARFRTFFFNSVNGYTTPTPTSLSAAGHESADGVLTMQWVLIQYSGGNHYFLYSNTYGFFDVAPQPSPPPYPSTFAYANMTFVAAGPADFGIYISTHYSGWVGGIQWQPDTATITGGPIVPGLNGKVAFKSGASYQVSIEFLDHAGRKCGILYGNKVNIPDRSYGQIDYTTLINWSLSNTNALAEIPTWAYYFSINITKCLTTRFFLQARGADIKYATKDSSGVWAFTTTAYAANLRGVGIDITTLNSFGMGYTFADGDLVKVYINGDSNVYNLSIIAQTGNWIVCELGNLGSLAGTPKADFMFQIYTPYKPSTSEPAYEVGQIYTITNPATNSRAYSTLAGSIGGDITLLTRNDGSTDYLTENMSPNDKFYEVWNTDSGRPNFIDTIGQVTKTNTISYSNTLIQGTKTNGLSTFDALDTKDVSIECGTGEKLQVANKIAVEQGSIMLAICQNQTASCYLGETQLLSAVTNAFVAQSDQVIGTINILQGSFGTINPESVVQYLGLVFWIDIKNGSYVQYSTNGLEPVSRFKQVRFFKNYAAGYINASTGNLDAINGFHHIRSMIDPFTKEILVTLPALIYQNYANNLPSYTSVPSYATSILNRFDISDSLGKTMSFSYEENQWGSNYEWLPEWSEYIYSQMYLFKNGDLYIANSDTSHYNTVFGTTYAPRICISANVNPSQLKDLSNIAVEASQIPNFTVAMSNYPNIQITDLSSTDDKWVNQEGVFYADFMFDRLSPNASGSADEKMWAGDPLTDVSIFIMVEWQAYTNLFYCNFVNVGWRISKGQRMVANPINQ